MVDGTAPPATVQTVDHPARPSLTHARTVRRFSATAATTGALIVAILTVTGALTGMFTPTTPNIPQAPTPWDYTIPEWDQALGGDTGLTPDSYTTVQEYTDPTLDGHHEALHALARQVTRADLTGQGQPALTELTVAGLTPYWPTPPTTGTAPEPQCHDITIQATSPTALPVTPDPTSTAPTFAQYAKVLVAFTGTCQDATYDLQAPGIRYVYAGKATASTTGWVPLRSWQVPAPSAHDTLPGATEPYDWELKTITQHCVTPTVVRARIAVVDALEHLCQTAASDGVPIEVTSGYRTRAEQAWLFNQAVQYYGTPANAREHVAYADNTICTSRHCSGIAVNVAENPTAAQWLTSTVGCVAGDGTVTEATQCDPGTTPVPNLARWGFIAPLASSPGYLEFTLPLAVTTDSSLWTPNCNPAGLPVANQVAAIFRCRLAREGIVGPAQDTAVAEALVVSRCESGWNPTAAAFAGRYATTPHPGTGRLYTHRGVFMLTTEQATAGWVPNGIDGLTDPVANINAAASLWLTTRGWEQFGCATGVPEGFEAGPVLPQYGGPDLPDWAHQY